MTGFNSKRQAAQAKLDDDNDTQVYADTLTVVYQRGFSDGKNAAEQKPCVGKDPRCPCQDGDACHYKDCGDTKALPVPVAQPAQEPVAMYEDWYNTKSCGHCGMVGGHAKSCRHYTIPQKETEK